MRLVVFLLRLVGGIARWLWMLEDAFPPYRDVEGQLEAKETRAGKKQLVCVGSTWVEVDDQTYDILVVGENLRVRYTRRGRAISIDRLLPGRGPG